jgi:uncharacterized protein YcbK (DUF882 family)
MLRTATFGAVFLLATAIAMPPASAQTADPQADQASEDGPEHATAGGDAAQPQAGRKRARGGKRSKRMSGRVVPDEQLRQVPLPRPSGRVHMISANTHDEADVNLFNEDGSYNLDAMEELSYVLRCRRTDVEKPIDPRLLTLLSHVYDHYGGKPLEIVSGYRNQRKQTSNHFKGTASDIRIKGVAPKKLRAFAETLDTGGMGIGLYPRSGFVHVDVRPLPSYRWIDYSPPNSNAAEKRPPRGWKPKKLHS